jgi:L-fuconolactonase
MDKDEPNIFIAMTIDSHVHFWKYDPVRDSWINDEMKVLQQDYLPIHFESIARRNGIDGVVAVQVDQSEVENHFMMELAKTNPWIKGIVGWIDLRGESLNERLQYFSQYPIIKGWRHIVQSEADDFLLQKDFQEGVSRLHQAGYTYDILIYHRQLPAAVDFIHHLPEQKLIIDHCAKPEIGTGEMKEWKSSMREIAQNKNIYCKVSGLFTEAKWKNWSAADFYPYLDVVFEAFGTKRTVFGSDWPVILLSGIYVQWKSLLEKYLENIPQEEKEDFFGKNAMEFYSLSD